jgi:hypothetical protein
MANKQLSDWIKSEEAQGYDEKRLKDWLLKKGYPAKDVDDAINSLKPKEAGAKYSAKEIFKPTILKCFFPALILIIFLASFFINSAHLPPAADYYCNMMNSITDLTNFSGTIREKAQEINADPQEIIRLYQHQESLVKNLDWERESFTASAKMLVFGNLYFAAPIIYKINPLFPVPCEALTLLGHATVNRFCQYYVTKSTYDCLTSITRQDLDSRGLLGGIIRDIPAYNRISFINLLIHSIILAAMIYAIISLIAAANLKLSKQIRKVKLVINGILIMLPLLIAAVYDYPPILATLPFILVFAITSFIKKDKHRKTFLYIMALAFILLLIGGIIIINLSLESNFSEPEKTMNAERRSEFEVLKCENTTTMPIQFGPTGEIEENPLIETWKICDNPPCRDICNSYCTQKQSQNRLPETSLRGDNPSCICGC